jgi:hypothetical protein
VGDCCTVLTFFVLMCFELETNMLPLVNSKSNVIKTIKKIVKGSTYRPNAQGGVEVDGE